MTAIADLNVALSDRYRLEREVGRGGMATVFLAHDLRVAIKVLRPELGAILGGDRFLREIHLTARLRHPHILPVYDSGDASGVLFYVTPLVEGGSLRDRLRREGRLPPAEAVRIAREVADALACAHGQGVIHRGIKPDNILLESGHATVADFGIARALSAAGADQVTQAGFVLGTPDYMSPEQALGQEIDARTDIYALGAVLYEMLAGEPPRNALLTSTAPELPAGAGPHGLASAVARALARSPADRFQSAAELGEALGRAAVDPPAPSVGSRRMAIAIATLCVLVTGAGIWLLLGRGTARHPAGAGDLRRGGGGIPGLVSRRATTGVLPHRGRLPQPLPPGVPVRRGAPAHPRPPGRHPGELVA